MQVLENPASSAEIHVSNYDLRCCTSAVLGTSTGRATTALRTALTRRLFGGFLASTSAACSRASIATAGFVDRFVHDNSPQR
jgi:hypothetical protein